MNNMEVRFQKAVEDAKFNLFEVQGFMYQPKLALIAGMAIGYKMAIDDQLSTLKEAKP